MSRLLSLLAMFALVLTNGTAIATAMCGHTDAQAHAAALQSTDARVASAAMTEDAASSTASKQATPADGAAVQLAGFLLPSNPVLPTPGSSGALDRRPADAAKLASRAISPLLQPPLA